MSDLYRVAEFAKLAGVTVRTLQYYDRIGLLSPSETTDGGHRLYRKRDLLRLQQILTLKWMGFKLSQIKTLLDSPTYDLHTALYLQKQAIDRQISSLQEASKALSLALDDDSLRDGEVDNDIVRQVIQAVMIDQEWLREAYTDETWAGVVTRRMQYSEADFAQFAEDWRELIDRFEDVFHLPANSEPVQALASIMHGYITKFTAGDEAVETGIASVWSNSEQIPDDYKMASPELMRFMQQALTIYRERKTR